MSQQTRQAPAVRAPRPRYDAETIRRRRAVALVLLLVLLALVVTGAVRLVGRLVGTDDAATDAPRPVVTAARATAPVTPTATPVVQRGDGTRAVVPGTSAGPGRGTVQTVRVEVERGAGLDGVAFADAVMATLNDPRSWGHGGTRTFARTDGPADVEVILASPETSVTLCRPLDTRGELSCSIGDRAIITSRRWATGTPEFPDLGVYRQYVVNHEVGHVLGERHERCPGAGLLAPVMQQQTKQVAPCTPNAWPFP